MTASRDKRSARAPLADRYGPPLPPAMIEEMAMQWYQDNKDAIDAYNEDVRRNGVPLKDMCTW